MAKRMSTAAKAALEAIKENDIHTAVKSTSEFKRELNEAAAAAEEDAYRNSNAYKREKAIKEFNNYFNTDTFKAYVHWAYVDYLIKNASKLSEELKHLSTTYKRTLTGVAKDPEIEKENLEEQNAASEIGIDDILEEPDKTSKKKK